MDRARAEEAARHARKEERQLELLSDRDYRIILWADRYMDRYGIDALIGLIPYAGDVVGFLFVIPGLRLSTRKIKSLPLTLAILYNFLIDACVGLVPFIGPCWTSSSEPIAGPPSWFGALSRMTARRSVRSIAEPATSSWPSSS